MAIRLVFSWLEFMLEHYVTVSPECDEESCWTQVEDSMLQLETLSNREYVHIVCFLHSSSRDEEDRVLHFQHDRVAALRDSISQHFSHSYRKSISFLNLETNSRSSCACSRKISCSHIEEVTRSQLQENVASDASRLLMM